MTGSSSEEIAENAAEIVADELGEEYGNGPEKGLGLFAISLIQFLIMGAVMLLILALTDNSL